MRRYSGILLTALLVGCAWFVWPTPYRSVTLGTGDLAREARIHRLTGSTEVRDRAGVWRSVGSHASEGVPAPAPPSETSPRTDWTMYIDRRTLTLILAVCMIGLLLIVWSFVAR